MISVESFRNYIGFPVKMRWYDTCSCMGTKIESSKVDGIILRTYIEDMIGSTTLDTQCNKISTSVYYHCLLDNGKEICRPVYEFHVAKDSVLEYHN